MSTVLIILAIAILITPVLFPQIGDKIPFLKNNKTKLTIVIGLLGLSILNASLHFARESKVYYVLNKWTGKRTVVSTPKPFFVMPFASEVREWDKYLEVKGIPLTKDGKLNIDSKTLSQIEGPIKGGVSVRFIDRVTADVYPSVRFMVPTHPEQFIKLVEKYRTQENLTMNTLVPTVSEQLKNVTFMFTADEYVSGGAVTYRAEIEDVLRNGSFVYRKEKVTDTIYAEPAIAGDTSKIVNRKRDIREIKVYEKNSKVTKDGVAIRKSHEINDNNIIVDQVIIDGIILEADYESKLKQQRDLAATAIVEAQKINTAKVAQQRIIAEGERDKALERVKQEKEQITKLISIETKVKEEESLRQLAEINVQTEKLKAEATRIAAEAEAYKNAKLVQAGLTPLEKAQIEKETKIGIARELSKMSMPTNMIIGGDKGTSNSTEALLQVKLLNDLTK